jgi:hypothetical protein
MGNDERPMRSTAADDHRRARTSAFVFRPQELTEAEGVEEAGREQT